MVKGTLARVAGLAIALTACTGNDLPMPDLAGRAPTIVLSDKTVGPAPAPTGSRRGGTVTVLLNDEFEHLDPARAYSSRSQSINLLLQRTLTAIRHNADGHGELVGDLATDTGRSSDDNKTWTFTLRDGLRFEDGTPITAHDVAYGIARSFSPELADGPSWLQQWLTNSPAYNATYRGPYDDAASNPPGVSTPDKRTIVFRFPVPQPDVPFVASLGNTTPVPRAKDSRARYDDWPVASGPYRIESRSRKRRMVLVRNEYWSPQTDPVRPAYPNRFVLSFGVAPAAATNAILADKGPHRMAISWEQVPPELLVGLSRNRDVGRRATVGPTAYVGYLKINTQRVRDLAVRRALNCAFDRIGYIRVAGGRTSAEPSTTLLPRIVVGHRHYRAYDCGARGDPSKAARMLNGRKIALRYGFRDNERGWREAEFLRRSLGKAGFRLELIPVESSRYFPSVRTRDNGLDIYMTSWGADWPTGATVIPALVDGRTISDRGNTNTSYFNDESVNAAIDRIRTITDFHHAGREWGALDESVMRNHAPLVPVYYDRTCSVNGSRVGGVYLHEMFGVTSLVNIFVR